MNAPAIKKTPKALAYLARWLLAYAALEAIAYYVSVWATAAIVIVLLVAGIYAMIVKDVERGKSLTQSRAEFEAIMRKIGK